MIALYDHIQQLQDEWRNAPSRRQRAAIAVEMKKAIAEQTALDRALDQMFEALAGEGVR